MPTMLDYLNKLKFLPIVFYHRAGGIMRRLIETGSHMAYKIRRAISKFAMHKQTQSQKEQ